MTSTASFSEREERRESPPPLYQLNHQTRRAGATSSFDALSRTLCLRSCYSLSGSNDNDKLCSSWSNGLRCSWSVHSSDNFYLEDNTRSHLQAKNRIMDQENQFFMVQRLWVTSRAQIAKIYRQMTEQTERGFVCNGPLTLHLRMGYNR